MKVSPGVWYSVVLYAVAGACWACAPDALDYPAFPVVLLELSVALALFPAARIQPHTPLTPMNWAVFLFHIHAVVVPLLGLWLGFDPGTLPGLPETRFINAALLLSAAAHWFFCAGAQAAAQTRPRASPSPLFSAGFDRALVVAFAALGVLGLLLTFGGPGAYLQYFADPRTQLLKVDGPATLGGAMGTFLRHFLPLGLVLWWSNGIRSDQRSRGRYLIQTLLLLMVLVPATASYNRASMIGPTLAVLAAYSAHVRRMSARAVAVAGGGLLVVGLLLGAYRSVRPDGVAPSREERMTFLEGTNAFLQVYGAGPQFTGFLLERGGQDDLHLGRSLLASALYPVPVLGKDFRESSGVTFYNRLIYGRSGIVDQVVPAVGELWLNFQLAGVALCFAAVGYVLCRLDQRFRRSRTAFTAAACFLVGTWVAFPIVGAVAVVSQIFVYSFWPFYAYFGLRFVLGTRSAPALAAGPLA